MLNLEEIWGQVLHQLQLDMPKASYETWAKDTQAHSLEKNVLTVCARNAYARDWLESRMTTIIQNILKGILDHPVTVRFVSRENPKGVDEVDEEPAAEESELDIEPMQWLDYDCIVQPHKQIVVKGYLRRLGMEIGPKAIWLYIGFHQAAWRAQEQNPSGIKTLHSQDVMRFSGLSNGAFWRLLKHTLVQQHLQGLVQRAEEQSARRYRRGRDGRPHRSPVRYQVFMTPRLTHADALAIHARIKSMMEGNLEIHKALQELLAIEDVMELLTPNEPAPVSTPLHTVMDIVRLEAGKAHTPEMEKLAQQLHRRVISVLGDIHIPHFFITHTIHVHNLTPAQAWLITVSRDMAFINSRTGERRDLITFKRGYLEMAELIGSGRYKTVQAWLHPHWNEQRGGNLSRFLMEMPIPDSNPDVDLRVESMPRVFRVLLEEPLDADGSIRLDANGSHMADANGRNSWTQVGGIVDAHGSHMLDANGSALNTIKHVPNTDKKNTSTTQHARSAKAEEEVPSFWVLESLLGQNDVHPKVQKELLDVQASVHAFVSWVLYVASPQSGNLSDPLGYALSRLREHPLREARGAFRQFADLPPSELLLLIQSTPHSSYALPGQVEHPLARVWKKAMGSHNPMMPQVYKILFGNDGEE